MRLKHQKVFNNVCEKFNLTFGKEYGYPNNYTSFYEEGKEESFMRIEQIPVSKKYTKIVYVMFDNCKGLNKQIYDTIISEYKEQKEGVGIDTQIDNNGSWDSCMV